MPAAVPSGEPREADAAGESPLVAGGIVGFVEGAALYLVAQGIVLLAKGQTEKVEEVLYLIAFVAALPVAVASTLFWARRLPARELSALAAYDGVGLLVALVVARFSGEPTNVLLAFGAALLVANRLLAGPWRPALAQSLRPLSAAIAPFLLLALIVFLPSSAYGARRLGLTLVVAFAGAAAYSLLPARGRRRPRRSLDALAVVLIVLAVWDLTFWGGWLLDNQNFYLGAVNEVLHGRTILVDIFPQYGVGVMYALAAFFAVVHIGYGTFSLLLGALTALELILLYAIVRVAGRSQLVAVLATAVAIVFVIYGQIQSYVAYPSTGPLRFGLPYPVILLELLALRQPAHRAGLQRSSAAITALASLWSFEAFAYTLAAYLAIVVVEAISAPGRARDVLRRRVAPVVAGVVAVQVVFAVVMRLAAGAWPDWGTYLDFIRLYSVRGFYTLPVTPWSPGFALAGLCFASALAVCIFVLRRPGVVRAWPELFAGLAGSTAFAIVAFSYFLGRSHPNNLHHVAPPAFVFCALWLALLDRTRGRSLLLLRLGFAGLAVWAAGMLFAGTWGDLKAKLPNSALGTLAEHPLRLGDRVGYLAHNPVVDPRSAAGVALMDRYDPGRSRSLVLIDAETTSEVLFRMRRGNVLPISTPPQDIVLPSSVHRALDAVAGLPAGTVMLTNASYLSTALDSDPFAALTQLAVWQVRRQFELETLAQTEDGLAVVRLGRAR